MSTKLLSSTLFSVVSVLVLLTGCSASPSDKPLDSGAAALNIPDSNPWKTELTEEFESSKVPFVRAALADGVIADSEWAEMQSRYSSCMGDLGLKVTPIGVDGAERIEPIGDEGTPPTDAEETACADESGHDVIGALYSFMRGNPNNEDPVGLLLQCLKDRGVVEKGVKLDQFKENHEDWDYMNSLGKDHDECADDPKGWLQ